MATNGYNNDQSGEGKWPYDPFPDLPDDSDDIMNWIHIPDDGDLDFLGELYPPPAAPMQNSGDPIDGTAVAGNGNSSAMDVDPSTSARHQDVVGASDHQNVLDCTGCQILREVLHSNGFETAKLCIHGAAGVFYHATVELYQTGSESLVLAPTHRYHIDFRGRDYLWVKQYLVGYAQQRASDGCAVLQDSISAFHDVLCTSMTSAPAETANVVDDQQQQVVLAGAGDTAEPMVEQEEVPVASGPSQPNHDAVDEQEQEEVRPPVRSRFSIQRERASKLERNDISRYFHIPITAACKELGICATALKGVSRKFGIKAIDKQITKLRTNGNISAAVINEIEKLTDSRRKIIHGH
ncbi:hypothetical protein EJB05_02926 [Eragrostis curvula]|uniref:RWP-RK domain-containing protein n=1 Tax=Eragrostis curvula TaxID=38414 RepID=A0A5J9WXB6_9POAL|nr:hypothetical protein EJB05_02926 [Eragrostis curvula]